MELNSPAQPSSGVASANKYWPSENTVHNCPKEKEVQKISSSRWRSTYCRTSCTTSNYPSAPQQAAALPETQQPVLPTNKKTSLFKNPSKLTLPSKIAFPVDIDDKQFLEKFLYLPVSQIKGNARFNAFLITATTASTTQFLFHRCLLA